MANKREKRYFVGADVGFATSKGVVYSFDPVKGKGVKESQFFFPSRLVQGRNQVQDITRLGQKSAEPISYFDEKAGVEYTVASSTKSESTRFDGYHTSPLQRVLTQHLMQKLGVVSKFKLSSVEIATGLPISMFFSGAEMNKDLISEKIKSLKENKVQPLDGDFTSIGFEKVSVLPEAIGAYFDYIIDENGDIDESLRDMCTAMIDIGGRTSDIVVCQNLFDIDFSMVRGRDIGMLDVIESMRTYMLENFKIREDSNQRLEDMLFTGKYRYKGEQLEQKQITATISYAIKSVFSRLHSFVQQVLGEDAGSVDKILIVGGGAKVFGRELMQYYSHAKLVDEPQLANARGFAKYAMNTAKHGE